MIAHAIRKIAFWLFCCLQAIPLLAADSPEVRLEPKSRSPATAILATTDSSSIERAAPRMTIDQWLRVLLLKDYNTRVVILGALLLGGAAGVVGSFTLLRGRALMGDALSHATLPGIAVTFIVANMLGIKEKSLPMLLVGATLSGLLGVGTILLIRRGTRLKEDTALGIVLSVFFGAGVALLGVIQQMEGGHSAGLESFIYGKIASMGAADARLILVTAGISLAASALLFKELKLLCFDDGFAGSRGVPVLALDLILMALVVLISIVGLQAVGLILMIALLVIPAAAARFWTEKMGQMVWIAGLIGAMGGMLGAGVSALFSKLPSGAMIVLVCSFFFVLSLVFGTARGVWVRLWRRWRLNRSVDRQHLLRAIYESLEVDTPWNPRKPWPDAVESPALQPVSPESPLVNAQTPKPQDFESPLPLPTLLAKRSWSHRRLLVAVKRCELEGLVVHAGDLVRLTRRGFVEAQRLTRQHRLWELYLISHADVAPSQVDREADDIEHILEPEVVAELEALLDAQLPSLPASPHSLEQQSPQRISSADTPDPHATSRARAED